MNVLDIRALEQLQELIGGDRADLIELVDTFLDEGEGVVLDMHTAISNSDVELLRRSAHSLKGSAQDFGASQLATLCATLESGSKSAIPNGAEAQVSDVADQFIAAKHELKVYIES